MCSSRAEASQSGASVLARISMATVPTVGPGVSAHAAGTPAAPRMKIHSAAPARRADVHSFAARRARMGVGNGETRAYPLEPIRAEPSTYAVSAHKPSLGTGIDSARLISLRVCVTWRRLFF